MKSTKHKEPPRIPLFSEMIEESQDYDIFVFGSNNPAKKERDTFVTAFKRYIAELGITVKDLAEISGISKSTLFYYLSEQRHISFKYLCAVCIALRLPPARQRHLFSLAGHIMPDEKGFTRQKGYIIRSYLDACSYLEQYSLFACNKRLIAIGEKPLTNLSIMTEGKRI